MRGVVSGRVEQASVTVSVLQDVLLLEADASDERKTILRDNYAKLPPGTPPAQAIFAQMPMRFFDPRFDARPLFAESEVRPQLFEHVLGPLTAQWDAAAGMTSLRAPILVAHGRYDYVSPHTMWKGIVDAMPGVTMHLFERSGHQPFFEEPERFVEVVREWMARAGTSARQ